MKAQIFIKTILLSIMLTFSVSAWADGNDTIPPPPPNPFGDKIEIPLKKIYHERSLIEPIEAYYYNGELNIETTGTVTLKQGTVIKPGGKLSIKHIKQ